MAISTTTDLNSLYDLIYDDALTTLREENIMVGGGLVTLMSANGYAVRTVPIWSKASVNVKPEGVDYINPTSYQKTAAATFTPQVRMAQFLLTDEMLQTDTASNIAGMARAELGGALAEQVDIDMIAKFASLTESKGSAGNALTLSILGAAVAVLNNAKVRGVRSGVLHPYHWHDIWVLLGQPTTNQAFLGDTANMALQEYFVGRYINVNWFTSANIAIDGSDDATSAVFTREAFGYDEREAMSIEPERDASRKAVEMNASMGYAVGVLRQESGVKIIADATEPT